MGAESRRRPYQGEDPYVFVSYAHRNLDDAMEIVARMQSDGFRVWYDEGIDPGTEWDENIASHVEGCSFFLALVSPEYVASDNCKDELNYARDLDKQRVLIYLRDTELPSGMRMRLGRLQAIFKDRYADEGDFYEKLYSSSDIGACRMPGETKGEAGNGHPSVKETNPVIGVARDKLETARRLASKDSRKGLSQVADAADGLAKLLIREERSEEAEALFRESMEIRRELGDIEGVSWDMTKVADLLKKRGETEEAVKLYREAIPLDRILAEMDQFYRRWLETDLYDLARILRECGETEEAEALFRESMEIRRVLGDSKGVARAAIEIAYLLKKRGETEEAEALYREAISIYRDILEEGNSESRQGLAGAAHNLSIILRERGEIEEAEILSREAVSLYRELAKMNPIFLKHLRTDLRTLARILERRGKSDEAEMLYREASDMA